MFQRLNVLYDLIVPQYLIVTVFSILAFSMLLGVPFKLPIFFMIFSFSFAMFFLNSSNQLFDYNLDKINKPQRPLPARRISVNLAITSTILFMLSSILIAFFVGVLFTFVILLYFILSVIYSAPPFRLRRFLFASNFFGTIFHCVLPFIAVWLISEKNFTGTIAFLLFFSIFFFIIATTKDFEDMTGEKIKGYLSLPIFLGKKGAICFIWIGLILDLILISLCLLFGFIHSNFLYAAIFSYFVVILLLFTLTKYLKKETPRVTTHAKIVTIAILVGVLIEFSYGVVSVYLK